MTLPPLTLYYDGLCPLCSREIAHYRKCAAAAPIQFVDITDSTFDASQHGLDPNRVHRVMHVKVGDEVRTGLDAFIAIWLTLPRYRWLARLARMPGVHALLTLGYRAFAAIRPWLPRRKEPLCMKGTCKRY
jgi:predicted DCC family thiol-disulfide oxidoreductase YuxK